MINTFATKFSLASLSIAAVVQALPTDTSIDPVSVAAIAERFGPSGLLIVAVVALWVRSEQRTARDDRAREKKDEQFLQALQSQTNAIAQLKETMVEALVEIRAGRK